MKVLRLAAADLGAEQDRNNSTETELPMIKLKLVKVVCVASRGSGINLC